MKLALQGIAIAFMFIAQGFFSSVNGSKSQQQRAQFINLFKNWEEKVLGDRIEQLVNLMINNHGAQRGVNVHHYTRCGHQLKEIGEIQDIETFLEQIPRVHRFLLALRTDRHFKGSKLNGSSAKDFRNGLLGLLNLLGEQQGPPRCRMPSRELFTLEVGLLEHMSQLLALAKGWHRPDRHPGNSGEIPEVEPFMD